MDDDKIDDLFQRAYPSESEQSPQKSLKKLRIKNFRSVMPMKIDPKSQLSQNLAKSLLKNFKNQQVNFYPELGGESLVDKSMVSQRHSMLVGGKSLKKLKLKPKDGVIGEPAAEAEEVKKKIKIKLRGRASKLKLKLSSEIL